VRPARRDLLRRAGRAAIDATHATIEERFGVEQIVDGYGLTEVWPLGGNCPQSRALHIPEDIVAVECIDAESGAPVAEGEPGDRPDDAGRRQPPAAALPHSRRRAPGGQ
jgi:acyl-coenzyme A synthetase/AMP-(fatty) acid ligase